MASLLLEVMSWAGNSWLLSAEEIVGGDRAPSWDGVCPKQRPPWSRPVLLPTAVTHRRVQAGGGMSLAAVCHGFYAQKRGAEEPGTWGGEAAGKSQPSLNKHRGWSHGDGLEGRTSLPWGSATLLLRVSPAVLREAGSHTPPSVFEEEEASLSHLLLAGSISGGQ